MSSRQARLAVAAIALVVGACSGSTGGGGATNPPLAGSSVTATVVPAGTATPAPLSTPAPSPSDIAGNLPGATPGAIDPCTLLTTAEASKLIGRTLAAGVSQVLDPDRDCRWTDGHYEVTLILTPPAPDAASAQAYWDSEKAQLPNELNFKELTFFDRSAYASASVAGFSGSALLVIDGVYGFDLVCEFAACSQNASVATAQLIAGRLP